MPPLPLGLLLALAAAPRCQGAFSSLNPVTRVVRLLTEMKEQVEAEAEEDERIYKKMACWCETNDKEKAVAIKTAEKRIDALSTAIEEGAARSTQLASEISGLKDDIKEDEDSVATATVLRKEEKAEYEKVSKDLMDSIATLKDAVAVIAKVQLVQKQGARPEAVAASLAQVRTLVSRATRASALPAAGSSREYLEVMQKDLWDLLGTMPSHMESRLLTGFEQQPSGAVAGAKSYNARSSTILGLLGSMQSGFENDLGSAQRTEIDAELSFQRLRASKEGEISAAAKAVQEKTAELAETDQRTAESKESLQDTSDALEADRKFFADLKERCPVADKEYAERKRLRLEEGKAISEAIQILTEDDARDLFSATASFLQTGSRRHRLTVGTRRRAKLDSRGNRERMASVLLEAARRHGTFEGGWRLATLAVGVQLDGFEKVKEMMDKMVAELKTQQEEEFEKKESCRMDLEANEKDTLVKVNEKKDLAAQVTGLRGRLEGLEEDLKELRTGVAEAQTSLAAAGEDRKLENREFQQVVSDQRATIAILQKALKRLQQFYKDREPVLLAVRARGRRQEPGAKAPPPPPAGKAYEESAMSEGVVQMLEKIIQEAQEAEKEAMTTEQEAQKAYSKLVAGINEQLEAAETAITEKTVATEKAEAKKILTSKELKATEKAMANLAEQNSALHLACDYVLKNFKIRQAARLAEIEAVQEAKAILNGADFGEG